MDDDEEMSRRRRIAAIQFADRRGQLGLTQVQVADKAGVGYRTVQNLEAKTDPTWPQPQTRAKLEEAVGWPPGELSRLSEPPRPMLDPQLTDRTDQLNVESIDALIERLRRQRERIVAETPHEAAG